MSNGKSVGEAVIELVAQHGIDTAFGIPGVHTVELYRGLADSSIRHVTPRHEQGASFMADGYAAATGEPALCVLITGPGVTNAITGVAQAYHDSRPMLVLSSSVSSEDLGRGRGPLHDLPDQRGMMATVCAISETVRDPEELPELLRRAHTIFESGRPRPVHLSIPIDVLDRPGPPLEPLPREPARAVDPDEVARAGRELAGATSPIMILGGGSVDATDEALALAERLGAPIVVTGNAKGAVRDAHPLHLGSVLWSTPAQEAVREADLVIAVGTELSSLEVEGSDGKLELRGRLVRIDIDPAQVENGFPPAVGVTGDAREVLEQVNAAVASGDPGTAASGRKRASRIRAAVDELGGLDGGANRAWVERIAEALPEDAIVALDSTQLAYSLHETMPWSAPRSWLGAWGFGTLGRGLPMAIGAKVGLPDRPAVAIAGDGGALFTATELATAAQHRVPVTLVVWDSQSYEEIRDAMARADCPDLGTRLSPIDFPRLAESLGCRGESVSTPEELGAALEVAVAGEECTVIDVQPAS